MASTITAGTTSGTALNFAGDTSGILTVQGVTVGGAGGLGTGNSSIMKNRIINGAMVISQRLGTSSTNPASSDYLVDRFFYTGTQASKMGFQQNYGGVTLPVGFSNYLGMYTTSAYSVLTGDTFLVGQNIEGFNTADLQWGTANAKTVTLSFQVYSSLTGTFGGAITNSAADRSYPFSYSIPVANTWTSISVTIAGDTTGTWVGATNGKGIVVRFGLGSGATFSGTAGAWAAGNIVQPTGTVSVVGTLSATWFATGVQLEVGTSATGFEYRQYQQELALCQRYYYKNSVSTVTNQGTWLVGAVSSTTAIARAIMRHPITMRATPTLGYSTLRGYDGVNATAVSSIGSNQCTVDIAQVDFVCSGASFSAGRVGLIVENSSTSYIDCTAEL
jgi:hypothetical protein